MNRTSSARWARLVALGTSIGLVGCGDGGPEGTGGTAGSTATSTTSDTTTTSGSGGATSGTTSSTTTSGTTSGTTTSSTTSGTTTSGTTSSTTTTGTGGAGGSGATCPSLQSGVDVVAAMSSAPVCADAMAAPTTLSYASGADHLLDLRVPKTGSGPFPTVIWIHGGGWKSGARTDVQQAVRLVCQGYAVASIDYRLSGTAPFPAQIHDVKAAIRYLRANAAAHGLDPNRFATFGSSAGAHLSALAATSAGIADLEDPTQGNPSVSSAVQAAVAWYAPTDLGQMDAQLAAQGGCPPGSHGQPTSAESQLLGCTVSNPACAPAIQRANPITYVGANTPPVFMLHGSNDCVVPSAQTTLLQQAITAAGGCALKREVAGAGHGGLEWQSAPVQDTLRPFLDAVLLP